jgi:hypothetical protein
LYGVVLSRISQLDSSVNAVEKGTKEDLQGTIFWRLCSAPTVIWAIKKQELDEVLNTLRRMRNASNIFVGKPKLVLLRTLVQWPVEADHLIFWG